MNAVLGSKLNDLTRWVLPRRAAASMESVDRINEIADRLAKNSDGGVTSLADKLRRKVTTAEELESPEVFELGFALAVDSIRRTLGLRLYDVQILGGLVMALGRIAEMQTGEGKTLTVAPVAFLHSLAGGGVHVATTNAYLADRDFEELRDSFRLLGASVGLLDENGDFARSKLAYKQDITYGTGYQYGFDYLRDQMALSAAPRPRLGQSVIEELTGVERGSVPRMQRQLGFAIVDEIDSVLVDEAGTPLVLSGNRDRDEGNEAFQLATNVASEMRMDVDFQISSNGKQVELFASGYEAISRALPDNLQLARPWITYVRNALFAQHCVHRDIDYVVSDDQVRIVDQNTGRIFDDRSWRDGLHQAVESKESVSISESKSSLARITRQRYFQRYRQICGLTGTASGNEAEFKRFYKLRVEVIPPRKDSLRTVLPTRFFANRQAKYKALVDESSVRHQLSQPLLIGTRSIDSSKEISILLAKSRLPHVLLNGVQDENESDVIARAGRAKAITVATNMAGRGTDIKITDEGLQAGGLHVIGAEQNFSARVDRQLTGRSARKGDPGSCQFFVSADDELLRQIDNNIGKRMIASANESGECRKDFAADIAALQKRLEEIGFDKRRDMVRRDTWTDSVLETLNKED